MNSDQGSQFTSFAWTDCLRQSGIRISPSHACKYALPGQWMDGKGRNLDNIFIERLWRILKYECVYLTPALEAIASSHPQDLIDELLPSNFTPPN